MQNQTHMQMYLLAAIVAIMGEEYVVSKLLKPGRHAFIILKFLINICKGIC